MCVAPFFVLATSQSPGRPGTLAAAYNAIITERKALHMRLKDTNLTAKELKAMVKKYMVETYPRF